MKINVVKNILDANDTIARDNRLMLSQAGILAVNITSAPGSGKTALLESTIPAILPLRCGVVVGDLQTTRDADRLASTGSEIVQINTEGGCHLSASMVKLALEGMNLSDIDILFIENVGNMVCPAGFDLGEHIRVSMLSLPEGCDKVAKYPTLFQPADVILLSKMDLLEVLESDVSIVSEDLAHINTRADLIEISSKTGLGMDKWISFLRKRFSQDGR